MQSTSRICVSPSLPVCIWMDALCRICIQNVVHVHQHFIIPYTYCQIETDTGWIHWVRAAHIRLHRFRTSVNRLVVSRKKTDDRSLCTSISELPIGSSVWSMYAMILRKWVSYVSATEHSTWYHSNRKTQVPTDDHYLLWLRRGGYFPSMWVLTKSSKSARKRSVSV